MSDNLQRQYVESIPKDVQDLIYEGRKIEAVKLVREQTGLGLKEAKEKVEAYHSRMQGMFPNALPAQKKGAGCASVIVLLVTLVFVSGLIICRVG